MSKKVLIAIILGTVIVLGGGVYYAGNLPSKAVVEKTQGSKISFTQTNFNFKDIPYSGGNKEHGYKIKNTGIKDLTIANMATSCMCTKVFLKTSKEESPRFGMKGHTAESAWTGVIKPGEEAQVVVVFDPTAHGPSGVGPISRIVSFETNDPDKPYVEFGFEGTVVK